ncbi:eukaryotic translation initiation factor 4 gamma [Drosophila novamexicana]|uniref:eukaryotic translation initiation factor 4 gamma n=1 Tax=Drosophila novamexicana TaxID=47314 RepID=UPI0011E5C759|nr:eukaryotic translation initiation factor 4 gamma [Drosophila novamexicana]
MFILALFCLLAVGSQAKPLQPVVEPAQHIVIVTPQAQVHLEPALRYVHGLSPLARVSGPHHEETIVYVPAGATASVVPTVSDAVSTGRASSPAKQSEGFPQNINQIQQQAQQVVEIASGQFGEAASAAAAAGAGFFPGFFPSSDASNKNEEKLKNEKMELIETPANTQPLLAATEARHFYSLPQVYHTPVVDVVHAPVYSWPISAIRARSIQTEEAPIQALQQLPEEKPAAELPEAQPLLKEQKQPEQSEQPLEQLAQTIIPAAVEASELKAESAARQLEESNAIKPEQPSAEIAKETLKEAIKEAIQESRKEAIQETTKEAIKEAAQEAKKEIILEAKKEAIQEAVQEVRKEAAQEARKEATQEARKEDSQEPYLEARKEASSEPIQELIKEPFKETLKSASLDGIKQPLKEASNEATQPEPKLQEEQPLIKAIPAADAAALPEPQPQLQLQAQPEAQPAIAQAPEA